MIVQELINALLAYPPETVVYSLYQVVCGDEGDDEFAPRVRLGLQDNESDDPPSPNRNIVVIS